MNSVNLIGRLGSDPEMTYMESGKVKTAINIAVRSTKKDEPVWVNCVAWDSSAELIGEHFKSGSQIGIDGRLQTDKWEKDGKKHSRTYVVVEKVHFLDKKAS